jgi:transcription-repair coupling factor (superfamily II helicase)
MITLLRKHIATYLSSRADYQAARRTCRNSTFSVSFEGVQSGFLPFVLADLHRDAASTVLAVLPTDREAEALRDDLETVGIPLPALLFPSWEVLPYSGLRPRAAICGARAAVLGRLLAGESLAVVCSLRALISLVPPPATFRSRTLRVRRGDAVDSAVLGGQATGLGYLRVPRVSMPGELAIRGEVLDIFPFEGEEAIRIVLDFEKVSEIRRFDPLSQRSTADLAEVSIFPAREAVAGEAEVGQIRTLLEGMGAATEPLDALIEALLSDPELPGVELLLPLCAERPHTVLDYLGKTAVVAAAERDRVEAGAQGLEKEYRELYRQTRVRRDLAPPPERLLPDVKGLLDAYPRTISVRTIGGDKKVRLASEPPRSFFGNVKYFREEMERLAALGYTIFVFAVYEFQAERITAILKDIPVRILPLSISTGFSLPDSRLMVIHENEIFGRKRRIPRSIAHAKSSPIDSFVELNPGDFVVHVNYGIGLFQGIERMSVMGNERDYVRLEYSGGEVVFLPIEQVNLIQRYVGGENKKPKLDTIGGKSWENRKGKVRKSVEELAERLLKLYSRRRQSMGYAFGVDTVWQREFEAAFPYQETPDQLKCIEDVKADMERPMPMDRLVCGDVGYGKTEIALRAAFKAVMDGKQVAVLAPTTILAEQHLETFTERFTQFPVRIDMLSRFRTRGEQQRVAEALRSGELDIVIGTHRIIQKDIKFKNIGLLVVDEEQRFGVKDKERLKEIKTNVDCLTLTATPIPRTLHMSLTRIRDMSILQTPPQNRLPIETFIQEFEPEIVATAVRRELARGGQVYYLHNRIESMPETRLFLQQLLPEVSVDAAHGQMDAEELEDIMHRFVKGETQVLLATSIIENGLDIPNVNTIVIDRADMFGVSQLYQLRGRVGRSDEPAFAYLFYPRGHALSELAMKRLRIISDFTELGSGFKIALKDLEMRGAGNLLGREQSGEILAVGLDMYLRLLDQAIRELGNEKEEEEEVYLELEYSGYIPDSYIAEPMEKMEVYKLVASVSTQEELERVYQELQDRFGPIPDEVLSVLSIPEVRIMCRKLHVSSLREKSGVVTVEFSRLSQLDVEKALRLIREGGDTVFLNPDKPNCIFLRSDAIDLKEKSEFIYDKLSRLL